MGTRRYPDATRPTERAGGSRAARPSRAGRTALLLGLNFVGWYLLTASGHFYNVDEEALYLITEGLVERHSVALPRDAWGTDWPLSTVEVTPPDRPIRSTFAPGQSLAAVPFYLAGRVAAGTLPPEARGYATRFSVSLLNVFVTAATVALLYRLARALAYPHGAALGLAASYGLATFAWPQGRTFLAEPLTALLLLAAFAASRAGTASSIRAGWLVGAGAAMCAAVATKPHALLALPVLGLYLLGRAGAASRGGPEAARRVALATLYWGAGLLLLGLPYAAYNVIVYGGPLTTGYATVSWRLFTTPFLVGLYGLTLSTGKGLIWYAPPVVLALAGWRPFFRRHCAESLACLGLLLVHLAFYSRVRFWHGDWSWGPRFLLLALPFALLPSVATFDGLRARPARRTLVAAVLALGVAVQLFGLAGNFGWSIVRAPDGAVRWFAPAASPLLTQGRQLAERTGEWRVAISPPPDTAALTTGFAPPESDRHAAVFPRWTTGEGVVVLYPAAREPMVVQFTFFDHRPSPQRTDEPTILVNGMALPPEAIERRDFSGTGEGWAYRFVVPAGALHAGAATVTLRSATWNPKTTGVSQRDEDLGVFVYDVTIWRDGRAFAVWQRRVVPAMPAGSRALYAWFNDDRAADSAAVDAPAHHLVDWWMWYAAVAGWDRACTARWLAAYGALALVPFVATVAVLWPRGARRRDRRPWRRSGALPPTR